MGVHGLNILPQTNKSKAMDGKMILSVVKNLAMSQGSYGRLYERLTNDENALNYLVERNFSDPFDLIMFLEG